MKPEDIVLKSIAENQVLFDTLKERLVSEFSKDPQSFDGIEDNQLGQLYRARLVGRRTVETVFSEIARLRTLETKSEVKAQFR